jgi:hypothetical protein
MSKLERKINIQIFGKGIQLSTANGYNTTSMTRKDLQVLISDALIAERALGDAERARKTVLRAVS